MKKVTIKVKAKILFDEDFNLFTIFDENNKGGAIVSDTDPFKAMEKFKEATHLCTAARTLLEKLETEHKTDNFYVAEFI